MKHKAICILQGKKASGTAYFIQDNEGYTTITVKMSGFKPNSLHGFHIHNYGDMTNGCESMGSHYNPKNKSHGGLTGSNRHIGDLGNLVADSKGKVNMVIGSKSIKLKGKYSVVGRGLVVHQDKDDLGKGNYPDSKTTGHSGARIACGIIALME